MKAWTLQPNGSLKFKRRPRKRTLQRERVELALQNAQNPEFMAKYRK